MTKQDLMELDLMTQASRTFKWFHISRREGLTEIRPTKHDVNGRMPEPAVFVTPKEHCGTWALYIQDSSRQPVYLYGVEVPESAVIEEGPDGASIGDFKIITSKALPARLIKQIC